MKPGLNGTTNLATAIHFGEQPTTAVLQVDHWIPFAGILFIAGRRIDKTAAHGRIEFRIIEFFADLTVRDVFQRIELLILCGDFNAAAPAAGAIKIEAAGVGDERTVDDELVVVEALILRSRVAHSYAVFILDHRIFYAPDIEQNREGLRGLNARPDATFGIDLRIGPARLIRRRGLEAVFVCRFTGLGNPDSSIKCR